MSMARLWRDHSKRNEARDLLAPVYGWFTEGFDTLDLREAKALLGEMRGRPPLTFVTRIISASADVGMAELPVRPNLGHQQTANDRYHAEPLSLRVEILRAGARQIRLECRDHERPR